MFLCLFVNHILCIFYNHSSECRQCVAHLEASVAVLLNCLETVSDNESKINKGCFSSEEQLKCARFLQRIYEEVCDIHIWMNYDLNLTN